MVGYLETWDPGPLVVPLEGERVTVGTDPTCDVVLSADPTAARRHAIVERSSSGWCLHDLGSTSGTFVNGERVLSDRLLRPGDEVKVGRTRLLFRDDGSAQTLERVPALTNREHDVLLALCAPLLSGDLFTEAASVRDIASSLVVTEAAVRQHLMHLYEKFGIPEDASRRRMSLANQAFGRGAVTIADLLAPRRRSFATRSGDLAPRRPKS